MELNHPEHSFRIAELIRKFQRNDITALETEELMDWAHANKQNTKLFNNMLSDIMIEEELKEYELTGTSRAWRWMEEAIKQNNIEKPGIRGYERWFKYAAALIIIAGAAAFLWVNYNKPVKKLSVVQEQDVSAPTQNRAILTLADGTKIVLEDKTMGQITRQGNMQVIKLADNQLEYKNEGTSADRSAQFNTITTPKGSQYQLILPDGTKVWLNAETSLRYPLQFAAAGRQVELNGEAYFDVAVSKARPFSVKAGEIEIKVLATSFNVTSYNNEPAITTTLISGKVQVGMEHNQILLKPGQAGVWHTGPDSMKVQDNVNLEEITAWKNGLFAFNKASVSVVLEQLARWYDVKIEYKGADRNTFFTGELDRGAAISKQLEMIHLTGIANFRVSNRTVTVLPYISGQDDK